MAHVRASWEVYAGTHARFQLDTTGKTIDQIAEEIDASNTGVSVCHQCAREVDDPQVGELSEFSLDDVLWVKRDGEWVTYEEHENRLALDYLRSTQDAQLPDPSN